MWLVVFQVLVSIVIDYEPCGHELVAGAYTNYFRNNLTLAHTSTLPFVFKLA